MALRGEQLYDAIDKGILPSDTDTASLLQKLHETIASQIKQVRQFSRSFEATDFAAKLMRSSPAQYKVETWYLRCH